MILVARIQTRVGRRQLETKHVCKYSSSHYCYIGSPKTTAVTAAHTAGLENNLKVG